jgi:hypothetical protein
MVRAVSRRAIACAVGLAATAITATAIAGSAPGGRKAEQRVVVSEKVVDNGATYIEGAYSYLKLKRGDGTVVFHRRYEARMHLSRKFPVGRYWLVSYVRSCAGSCDYLDAPSDRCAAPFMLTGEERVHAVVRTAVGERCRIRFR